MRYLVAVIVSCLVGCSTTKDTSKSLAEQTCTSTLNGAQVNQIEHNNAFQTRVNSSDACYEFSSGKSFYEIYESPRPINAITIRSYFDTFLPEAAIFIPQVNGLDGQALTTVKLTNTKEGLDFIKGPYFEYRFVPEADLERFVIYTDYTLLDSEFSYSHSYTHSVYSEGINLSLGSKSIDYVMPHSASGNIEIITN